MSRKKPKLWTPFVPISAKMLKDETLRKLSSNSKVLFIYLRLNANGETKGIRLTYSSMKDMVSSATMAKGLKELEKAGFVKQIYKGGKFGSPALYKFVGQYADIYESTRRD